MASAQTPSGWQAERGRQAESPKEIPAKGWKDIAFRIKDQLGKDHVSIVAAGVTFYGFLAIFPTLAAMISVYGLLVDPATVQEQFAQLAGVMPQQAQDLLAERLEAIAQQSTQTLGIGVFISIFIAIWSAKKGMSAMIEGMNIAYDEEESRGFIKKTLVTLLFTVGGIIGVILSMVLVIGLPATLSSLGLAPWLQVVVRIVSWVLLAGMVLTALAVLYRYAPSRDDPMWRWVSLGSVVAAVLWLGASIGFSYYVSNFSSYNETYGSIAAVVILLMWMFISAYIILLGAELNSEIEHQTKRDTTVGPDEPMGERGAHDADTLGKAHTS